MDDKRFYRDLKKDIKKTGNRKRRHFLKDLSTDPGEFDYGSAESSALNGRDGKRKKHHAQKEKDSDKMEPIADSNDSAEGSERPQES